MRIAALVAVDAPPASYLLNLGGGPRRVRRRRPDRRNGSVASAVGKIVRPLGFAELAAEQKIAEDA